MAAQTGGTEVVDEPGGEVTASTGAGEPATTLPSTTIPRPFQAGTIAYSVEIVDTIPHDPDAFTQGFEVEGGLVFESTGQYGRSQARLLDLGGEEQLAVDLDEQFFGEGLTLVEDRLIQLTWREQTAFVRDADTLEELGRFTYDGEGWGICFDGARLVMSDGTSTLTFRDPTTFEATGTVEVTSSGEPVDRLNELECVGGLVMANRWQTNTILVIDPDSGLAVSTIDASPLIAALSSTDGIDVLNGIAWDDDTGKLYMTGKLWPEIFEVRLVPSG